MNGIIFCVCFAKCFEVMSKRTQKESAEKKVTAKSKPMMNLVSRCSERTPDVLASTASQSSEKTRFESQISLSPWNEQHQRTGRPIFRRLLIKLLRVECWLELVMEVRTGRPVYEQPPGSFTEHTNKIIVDNEDMDSDTVEESDMSWKFRSFLHRVQDQSSKDATHDSNKHSLIWWMFTSATLEASVFMGKNYMENLHSIENTGKDLTMKQMFDISEKLIAEQSDDTYGVNTISWEDSSWKHLSLIGEEKVVSLSHAKVYVFSDSVLCLGRMNENPQSNIVWEDKLTWFKSSSQYRALDTIDGEPMEFEWNNIPGFTTHCSSATKSKSSCQKWAKCQKISQDGSSSCRCSTTSHGDLKTMNRNANQAPNSFLFMRKDFHQEDGHSSDLDQKRSGILLMKANHKENGTESKTWWW